MQKRHENILQSRIEEVSRVGWSVIQFWEAYRWYDAERLGKSFYRDLNDRFVEENGEGSKLHIYPGDSALLLIDGDRLVPISDKMRSDE